VTDKANHRKAQMLISGMSRTAYWFGNLLADLAVYIPAMAVCTLGLSAGVNGPNSVASSMRGGGVGGCMQS